MNLKRLYNNRVQKIDKVKKHSLKIELFPSDTGKDEQKLKNLLLIGKLLHIYMHLLLSDYLRMKTICYLVQMVDTIAVS